MYKRIETQYQGRTEERKTRGSPGLMALHLYWEGNRGGKYKEKTENKSTECKCKAEGKITQIKRRRKIKRVKKQATKIQ